MNYKVTYQTLNGDTIVKSSTSRTKAIKMADELGEIGFSANVWKFERKQKPEVIYKNNR